MRYDAERALALLRGGCGNASAAFREGQEEAIRYVVEGRGRVLVVQKTGWGKSFVYFIAAKLLREGGAGPSLLISPLLSLMRNQLAAATRMGVAAATIHSDNQGDWAAVEAAVARDEVDVLLISPERLANENFQERVLARLATRLSLLVVDEAHCISDWGHDFRPHYRLLERIVGRLPSTVRVLATTATANNRVMADLQTVLGPDLIVSRGELHRPSLTLQTIRLDDQAERLAWLAENIPTLPGSGIVYTLTVRDAEEVAGWLKSRGMAVEAYTGQTRDGRPGLEDALLDNRVKALVATTALGMGFDKPDLGFVVHYQTPGSVVAYYQQVGRAGRALPSAYGVLLSGREDTEITEFFIESAFPTREDVNTVLDALTAAQGGLSVSELLGEVNLSKGRMEKALALLSLESPAPLAKHGARWQLTGSPLSEAFWQRAERLTQLRQREQEEMQAYVALKSGHMAFLVRSLDGEAGHEAESLLPFLPVTADPQLVVEAIAFLRRTSFPIAPRKLLAPGGLPDSGATGAIPLAHRSAEGRALCALGDAGWGALVREGRLQNGRFHDRLVAAAAELVREWRPSPAPAWVTFVPSLRAPSLVPDFAERLASTLGLPFAVSLIRVSARPPQATCRSSIQQARNVDGSLQLVTAPLPDGPVLLVDDIVDSRWTFTYCAVLLRKGGSGEVFPMALARASVGG